VLPFENFSPEPDQEYFADGMSEEILNVLSRIEGLRVTSRTSSFAFKDKRASIAEVSAALNVGHVLEGSVQKSGSTLRITAQLIDTRTDKHLWSRTFDRPYTAESMLAIQDEIAAAIVDEMKIRFADGSSGFIRGGPAPAYAPQRTEMTRSTEAYEAYLRGSQLVERRTKEGLSKGIADLERAVDLDPHFGEAHGRLGEAILMTEGFGDLSFDRELARLHIDKALSLAPASAEALAATAYLETVARRPETAIELGRRAVAANPNYLPAYKRLGDALMQSDSTEEALAVYTAAKAVDPLNPSILRAMTEALIDLGRLDEALRNAEEQSRLDPKYGRAGLASVHFVRVAWGEAHRLLKEIEADYPDGVLTRDLLFWTYARTGLPKLAEAYTDDWSKNAWLALAAGRRSDGACARQTQPRRSLAPWVAHVAGDPEFAYEKFGALFDRSGIAQGMAIPLGAYDDAIAMLSEFERKRDHRAGALRAAIRARFDGKSAEDFGFVEDEIDGAVWAAANGDAESAVNWLEACASSGLVFPEIRFLPEFNFLRDHPDFTATVERMDANAAAIAPRSRNSWQIGSPGE